jgi:dihydropyrimidinase
LHLDYLIKNGYLVREGNSFEGDIGIVDGEIAVIGSSIAEENADRVYDASGCYVAPGFVDAHTHMQLPVAGTVSSDNFFSGGRAAAWGGVTSIIDFTTPDPNQDLPSAIESRKKEAEKSPIDYSFHGTLYGYESVEPEQLRTAMEMGVTSFKFFTAYGESNRRTPDGELVEALRDIGQLDGLAMVHCENDEVISEKRAELESKGKKSIDFHPLSRPDYSESEAVGKVIHLAEAVEGNLHLAHLTTKESMEALERGKESEASISGETCPQYLLLTEEVYQEKDGHRYAATPPLRLDEDREALWNALESGLIDSVATDHCPFQNDQKDGFKGNFLDIPQGLPGVETLASLLFDEGVKKERISIDRMVELVSEQPAKRFGLYPQKGSLLVGTDADIVVFDPEKQKRITPDKLHMKTDFNPYAGKISQGWPRFVFLRGNPILEGNEFIGRKGAGKWINRNKGINW